MYILNIKWTFPSVNKETAVYKFLGNFRQSKETYFFLLYVHVQQLQNMMTSLRTRLDRTERREECGERCEEKCEEQVLIITQWCHWCSFIYFWGIFCLRRFKDHCEKCEAWTQDCCFSSRVSHHISWGWGWWRWWEWYLKHGVDDDDGNGDDNMKMTAMLSMLIRINMMLLMIVNWLLLL